MSSYNTGGSHAVDSISTSLEERGAEDNNLIGRLSGDFYDEYSPDREPASILAARENALINELNNYLLLAEKQKKEKYLIPHETEEKFMNAYLKLFEYNPDLAEELGLRYSNISFPTRD